MKPTYGLVSNRGVIPLAWSFDHVGVLARSVADAALIIRVMAGYDPLDPASSPMSDQPLPSTLELGHPPVIGLISSFLETSDQEVSMATRSVVDKLEGRGC